MDVPGKVPESINCHACNAVIDLTGQQAFNHVDCPQCGALSVVPLQFGNFLLLNPLGVGGMGTVYKAIDLSLSRYLALKILRKKLASRPEFIESFSREARAAAAVNHPNIAQVYSFGEFEGQYYLAMELLERGSLDDRLSTLGKLPEKDVLDIGRQIAAGLRAAHSRSLLHRDIKPGNILFGEDNIPKLVDFGLARAQHEAQQASSEPIWGTPYYIAPEKLRGQPEDLRSDMYSLGAMLFHVLAGRPPFDAATASEVVTKHATQPAYSLKTYAPTVQGATTHLIGRMLSKNPAERYATYDELLHDFDEAIAAVKYAAENRLVTAPSGEQMSFKSIITTVVIVLVGVAAVVFVYANRNIFFEPSAPPPAMPPPSSTSTTLVTVPPPAPLVATTVDFNEDSAWIKAWNRALLQLTQGKYQDALQDLDSAKRLLAPEQRKARQWITYFEGLTLQAMDRPTPSLSSFVNAIDKRAAKEPPADVTTGSLVDALAYTMANQIPLATMESAAPRMPGWAAALTYFSSGFKHLEAGEIEPTIRNFRLYLNLPVDDTQRWVFNLRPLADRLVRDCQRASDQLAEADRLQKAGQFTQALAKLTAPANLSTLRPQFDKRRADIEAAIAAQQKAAEQAKQQEEQHRRELEAREAERAAAEQKLLQALEPEISPLLARYDFTGLEARYAQFAPTVETAVGKRLIAGREAGAKVLQEFKAQLAADFAARPFDAAVLPTKAGVQLMGRLARATDAEVFYTTTYGEIVGKWSDLPPAALVKMAASYATAAANTETPDVQARRYLMLSVFCRNYGQDKLAGTYSLQATQLSPAVGQELQKIFGDAQSTP